MDEVKVQENHLSSKVEAPIKAVDIPFKIQEKGARENNAARPIDVVITAYLLFFDSAMLGERNAQIQSKQMQTEADGARSEIAKIDKFSYIVINQQKIDNPVTVIHSDGPNTVTWVPKYSDPDKQNSYINNLNTQNTITTAIRGIFEERFKDEQSSSEVSAQNLNAAIDITEQAVQSGKSLLSLLENLTYQISAI